MNEKDILYLFVYPAILMIGFGAVVEVTDKYMKHACVVEYVKTDRSADDIMKICNTK